MRTGRTRIYVVYFFTSVFTAVTWLTGARLLEGGCTVTALTWRIVMTRCCYDTSTDLTPERRVYIDRLTSRT